MKAWDDQLALIHLSIIDADREETRALMGVIAASENASAITPAAAQRHRSGRAADRSAHRFHLSPTSQFTAFARARGA